MSEAIIARWEVTRAKNAGQKVCECGCGGLTTAPRFISGHNARQKDPLARLMSKVVWNGDEEECWIWEGARDSRGYGCIQFGGRPRKSHRVSYELHIGPIPEGLVIDHLCRNARCVNPAHLETVTQRENVLRGKRSRKDLR